MIHNTRACLDKARAKLPNTPPLEGLGGGGVHAMTDSEVLTERPGDAVQSEVIDREPQARSGCDQRRQQFKEGISEDRCARMCACLEGRCSFTDADEAPMMCVGRINGAPCPARLHQACRPQPYATVSSF